MATTRKPKPSSTRRRKTPTSTTPLSEKRTESMSSINFEKKYLSFAIGAAVVLGLLYFSRGFFVAALVNGAPISRLAVVEETERAYGKQAIDTLITKKLLEQEIRKQNISVSNKEIDDEVKRIESLVKQQGQDLATLLKERRRTMGSFRDEVRLQLGLQKLMAKQNIVVTDKEIADWVEKNKQLVPEGTSEEETKKIAEQQLRQVKEAQKTEEFIMNLKRNARINYFVQY